MFLCLAAPKIDTREIPHEHLPVLCLSLPVGQPLKTGEVFRWDFFRLSIRITKSTMALAGEFLTLSGMSLIEVLGAES